MNATGPGLHDVAVVGLGPAGRALASRAAAAGLSVLAIDPAPDAPWHQTLSLWADQLPPWLTVDVLAHTVHGPALCCPSPTVLDRQYAVVDTGALQEELLLGPEVTVERAAVDRPESLLDRAHRVVDCRGAGRPGRPGPMQTAYGLVVDAADAEPALRGAPALFMDWRTDYDAPESDDDDDDDEIGPTFLYAIPLDQNRVLLEETCLAGFPAPSPDVLAVRLRSRLRRRGVSESALQQPLAVEEVRIPLLPPRREFSSPRIEAFGTAGGQGHAATGYSVAATWGAIPAVVHSLCTGYPIPAPRTGGTTALTTAGLRALIHADEPTLHELFRAFGRIDGQHQQWFLDGTGPTYQVAAAMWKMWSRMPVRSKVGMIAAVSGSPVSSRPRGIRGTGPIARWRTGQP